MSHREKEDTSSVVFHINGKRHAVNSKSPGITSRTVLADYIRNTANLKGTKVLCREGGCGVCIVTVKTIDPGTGSQVIKSINSCLTPVLSCDGWDISTIERLGNKHEGYHEIQNRLVKFHGTQCGFCTPGMVMSMYSVIGAKGEIEMKDVEKSLDGNICRCTGYRPILDAFKFLSKDAPVELKEKCADIEDCASCPLRKSNSNGFIPCENVAKMSSNPISLTLSSGEKWVTAKTLESALMTATACKNGNGLHRFVAGNTSTGIFKDDGPYNVFIDINSIPDLKKSYAGGKEFVLGSGSCFTEAINLLRASSASSEFKYAERLANHLERVANTSVRNNATFGGNLIIKHDHREFPSDVYVLLEAVGATVTLAQLENGKVQEENVSLDEFLKRDMSLRLITSIHLPQRKGYHFRALKVTRSYQNDRTSLNGAFLLPINQGRVGEGSRLVFGGISKTFSRAFATEDYLTGRNISDQRTLHQALSILESEMKPDIGPMKASPNYRIHLAKTFMYKTFLELLGSKVRSKFSSGSEEIPRNLMRSKQSLDGRSSDKILYQSAPKYEGAIQTSGEAEYTGDIPIRPDELFAAFVLTTVGSADIKSVDADEALKIPGVVAFVSAKDIPGENNAMNKFNYLPMVMPEPVFASGKALYHGQPIGLIMAGSRELASEAAKRVQVTYENVQKPVVKIHEAVEKAKSDGTFQKQTAGVYTTQPVEDIKEVFTVKGKLTTGSQYHFHMEPQTCVCHPREDGIDVYSSTQWINFTQISIANVLNIPMNSINMQVRRLGGGFGAKLTRPAFVATACAVATWVTKQPVRLVLDLDTNMSMLGKRQPHEIPYEVSFDEMGRIAKLTADLICDVGQSPNDASCWIGMFHMQNAYKAVGWTVDTHFVMTNTPSNTFCRAPGSVKSTAAIEWIMDHIAHFLKIDPIAVRRVNFLETGDPLLYGPPTYEGRNLMPDLFGRMMNEADYEARSDSIRKFNEENRWRKRGISVVPVRFALEYFGTLFPASIVIYRDGHIAVSHGGIEMGQGINTKVLQTVAHTLEVPTDRIKIKPTNNFVGANAFASGASITSELICYSAKKASEELKENLIPVREKLENPSWEEVISSAFSDKVKLSASYTPTSKDDIKGYEVWVLNCTEIEIDVLTGEYKIVRTDLYEDTGNSLSPAIDMGQVEGAYVFGLGYWTTEKIVHDENNGKLLSSGTCEYKPPGVKDIPEDFRVTLLNNAPNPNGVLRSKVTGEPAADSTFAVVLALRNAIASARADAGNTDWFEMDCPVTPEDVTRLCLTNDIHLTLGNNA